VLGSATCSAAAGESMTLAVVHEFIANEGTAWDLFDGLLDKLYETVLPQHLEAAPVPEAHLLDLVAEPPPELVCRYLAGHLRHARLLGQRTAEVHLTLAGGREPGFGPEPFTMMYQQSLFQGARGLLARVTDTLSAQRAGLSDEVRPMAAELVAAQPRLEQQLRRITARLIAAVRVRAHGDLHLGQVLFTGDDFVLVDFEGEPARPLRERRYRRQPLRDVAAMLRSFSYAAESSLIGGSQRPQDAVALRPWATAWRTWMSAAYLAGYLELAEPGGLLPAGGEDRRLLLDFYLLDKCIYEVAYELNNRPAWLPVPLADLLALAER
jgi:maltose alpha-D-glucosyltransferase/alpha-amylase